MKIEIQKKKKNQTLYVRISPENRDWIRRTAKKKELSESKLVDLLFSQIFKVHV